VADFGIALAAAKTGGTRMTETGMSLGTPRYMSPEQAMGERDVTARSDIYALGCVLYEMLTGEAPFTGTTAQAIVAKVLTEKPAPIIPRRDRVAPHVEEAVLTALEKLPADRFATAAEFVAAIKAEGTATRTTTRVSVAASRRSLLPFIGITAALAALAALGGWLLGRGNSAPDESAASRLALV
jgi:serine/threonine-protein kinase